MTTTGYTPNLTNPKYSGRTLDRLRRACGWARACLGHEPREISKTWIDSVFGQQQNELAQWLRAKLLLCTDERFYFGDAAKCKKYVLNEAGYAEVRMVLRGEQATPAPQRETTLAYGRSALDTDLVLYWARHAYGSQLAAKTFSYESKSSARLWHPLQNLAKAYKAEFWPAVGFSHNYDIKACAPTLIYQYAKQQGMDEWLFGIEDFLQNTQDFRQHVAGIAGIPMKDAKALLNALFCGAKLGANEAFALFDLLDRNRNKVKALKADKRFQQFRQDVKACWKTIEPTLTKKVNQAGRKLPLSSKLKWGLYFDLERKVLDVIADHLTSAGNNHFLEHDGFRTSRAIDAASLQEEVFARHGFKVQFSHEFFTTTS